MGNVKMELIADYLGAGFKLIPIKPNTKKPTGETWEVCNTATPWENTPLLGVSVHLGGSGLVSLDVDSPDDFAALCLEFGFELPKTYTVTGRNPRYIYRSDAKFYKSLSVDKKTIFEIRGGQHYDLLPPSIHPDTKKPYTAVGSVHDIAELPSWVYSLVENWDALKSQLKTVITGEIYTPPAPAKNKGRPTVTESVGEIYNAENSLKSALERYGYKKMGRRYLSPHSKTGLAGVYIIDDQRCWIHHASDPLCSNSSGRPVSAFDLCVSYDFDGDYKKACKALGKKNVTPVESHKLPEFSPIFAQEIEIPAPVNPVPSQGYYRFLGYAGDSIYILPAQTGAVVEIKIPTIKKNNLLQIAPLAHWDLEFPKKTGTDWDAAMDFLIQKSYAVGVFDPEKIRGAGAWFDDGKVVIHCGDKILQDGQEIDVTQAAGKYIYEKKRQEIRVTTPPATDSEAQEIPALFSNIKFSDSVDYKILAGWAALAPICGALEWRPHVWLTASRGSGKTWIQQNMLHPLLSNFAVFAQGGTTEAGLRQAIDCDARPVVFDEAESESVTAQERIQKVIELARQSSSESSAHIIKGSKDGAHKKYLPRAMFLMSSINNSLKQSADLSRFTVLEISRKSDDFKKLDIETGNLLTTEFCDKFRRRMIDLIPTIRKNARKLAESIAEKTGNRRLGDQLGALISGFVATQSTKEITKEEADLLIIEFLRKETAESNDEPDEQQALSHVMQSKIKVESGIERTISELIAISNVTTFDDKVTPEVADKSLQRLGLKARDKKLHITNSNVELNKILGNIYGKNGLKNLLMRIAGAWKEEKPAKFAGLAQRYYSIPIAVL
jgi:Bifunctional DNA primase/polymerase, N-terminal